MKVKYRFYSDYPNCHYKPCNQKSSKTIEIAQGHLPSHPMTQTSLSPKSYLILFVLAVIWGSSFILIKKALLAFDPMHLAAMRLLVAGTAFVPILALQWKKIDWSLWPKFLIVSITGSGLPAFMFFIAQTEISSSVSGLLNSLTPIWTLLIGVVLFRLPFELWKLSGVLLGLVGTVILITYGNEVGIQGNLWYCGFVIVATVCYGISVNVVKAYLQEVPSLVISSVTLVFSALLSFIYLCTTDVVASLTGTEAMWYSLWSLIILALASTFFATILFYRLVKDTNAIFASTITYLIPIVAFVWGWWDGEPLTLLHLLGMALIMLGVYVIKKK